MPFAGARSSVQAARSAWGCANVFYEAAYERKWPAGKLGDSQLVCRGRRWQALLTKGEDTLLRPRQGAGESNGARVTD